MNDLVLSDPASLFFAGPVTPQTLNLKQSLNEIANMCKSQAATQAKNQVVENSSGTHLLEVHIPSMGVGMGVLFIVMVVLGLLAICLLNRLRRTQERRVRSEVTSNMPAMPASAMVPAQPPMPQPQQPSIMFLSLPSPGENVRMRQLDSMPVPDSPRFQEVHDTPSTPSGRPAPADRFVFAP